MANRFAQFVEVVDDNALQSEIAATAEPDTATAVTGEPKANRFAQFLDDEPADQGEPEGKPESIGIGKAALAGLEAGGEGIASSTLGFPDTVARVGRGLQENLRHSGEIGKVVAAAIKPISDIHQKIADLFSPIKAKFDNFVAERSDDPALKNVAEKAAYGDKAFKDAMKGDFTALKSIATDPETLISYIGQGAPSLAFAYAGGLPAAFLLEGLGASESARDFEQKTGAKISDEEFATATSVTALVAGSLEMIGLGGMKSAAKGAAELVKSPLKEAATEGVQSLVENSAQRIYDPNADLTQGVLSSAIGGAGLGGVGGGLEYAAGQGERAQQGEQAEQPGAPLPTTADELVTDQQIPKPITTPTELKAAASAAAQRVAQKKQQAVAEQQAQLIQAQAAAKESAAAVKIAEKEAAKTPPTTADEPTPESRATLNAQLEAFKAGTKPAVLFTEGNEDKIPSPLPPGTRLGSVNNGILLYKDISDLKAARAGKLGAVLGYGIDSKPDPEAFAAAGGQVITARNAEGVPIQDVATDGSPEVIAAAQQVAGPNGSVESRPVADALIEREALKQQEEISDDEEIQSETKGRPDDEESGQRHGQSRDEGLPTQQNVEAARRPQDGLEPEQAKREEAPPVGGASVSAVDAAANEAATSDKNDLPEPTPGQMEAGNYKKGHVSVAGLDISIENPKGSERVAKDGSWRVPNLPAHYGYIKGTKGADGDHVDVFVGPHTDNGKAFIVNQNKPGTQEFDEHKVILGADTAEEAKAIYDQSFTPGFSPKVFGSISPEISTERLKEILPTLDKAAPAQTHDLGALSYDDLKRVAKKLRVLHGKNAATTRALIEKRAKPEAISSVYEQLFGAEAQRKKTERSVAASKLASERLRKALEFNINDDLITGLRKRGGINTDVENDFKGRLNHLDKNNRTLGLFSIERTGKDKQGAWLGMTLDQAALWAKQNGYIQEHNARQLADLLSEAETGRKIYSINSDVEARVDQAQQDAQDDYDQEALMRDMDSNQMLPGDAPDAALMSAAEFLEPEKFQALSEQYAIQRKDDPRAAVEAYENALRRIVDGEEDVRQGDRGEERAPAEPVEKPDRAAQEEERASRSDEGKGKGHGSLEDEIKAISDDDLAALIDEVAAEIGAAETNKPAGKRAKTIQSKGKSRPRKARAPAEHRPAKEIAKEFGINLDAAGREAIAALAELFGGAGKLNSGLAFDEETYAKAKPHFAAAYQSAVKAGKNLREFVRAILEQFGTALGPYIEQFTKDIRGNDDAQRSSDDLERDSGDAKAQVSNVGADDAPQLEGNDGRRGGGNQPAGEARDSRKGGAGVLPGGAAIDGKRSDQPVRGDDETGQPKGVPAGADLDQRGGGYGDKGIPVETVPNASVEAATDGGLQLADKRKAQRAAERIAAKPGDLENIKATLPYLLDGQQQDVFKAETRYAKPDGYGILFTNGTGTGKTFTGLGVIKRFARQGKNNVLVVAPNDKIIQDWQESADALGLKLNHLDDTKTAGKGQVITTFANLGINKDLASRNWDLVVVDEAQYLMQNEDGEPTEGLRTLRAITKHPDGKYARHQMLNADLIDALASTRREMEEEIKAAADAGLSDKEHERHAANVDRLEKLLIEQMKAEREAQDVVLEDVKASQGAARPRALFLSATPFAYVKTVDWAQGYLFEYANKDADGYNSGNGREQFFMQHFGYRMRYNKLTQPDAKVDSGIMERQFNAFLKKDGVLSGRMLDVKADYDRKFILVDSAIGVEIDRALAWVWDQGAERAKDQSKPNGYRMLDEELSRKFDYLSRRYLLEAIKAQEVVEHVKQHMDLGRKVVVFHDYKKGGAINPFQVNEFSPTPGKKRQAANYSENELDAYRDAVQEFNQKFSRLVNMPFGAMASPINTFKKEFPNVLLFNGDVKPADRRKSVEKFQDDATGPQVILVQSDAGKAGISLHDTTGKHQRALFNLGQPTQPTTAIQQEGRIYRTGQVTDAMFRYLNTGTNWERWAFATTIANRASTAENLAMGEQARALKDAFIAGFEESGEFRAGDLNEGKGGKERDRAANEALTEYDRAKAFYYGTAKKNSKTKAQEGKDYFATPEPVGLKMVQWADARPGEDMLEPSAGHGAIARWFRNDSVRTAVEPSGALAPRLAMVFDGKIERENFEDLHVVNKYDAIVMNPPFGSGGSQAIQHLDKATKHLREGGRVVALIPTGPAADKKFDKWLYEPVTQAIKPVVKESKFGPIYKGDTLHSRATWAPISKLVKPIDGGYLLVKIEGKAGEVAITQESLTSVDPTGARNETITPNKDLALVADIKMPQVTFERAGTAVATRIVVLDKLAKDHAAPATKNLDYADITDINELFKRLEDRELPPRQKARDDDGKAAAIDNFAARKEQKFASKPASKPAPEPSLEPAGEGGHDLVEYTTAKGKVLTGVVRTDLTREQALAIDAYTFRLKGGWFIRQKYLMSEDLLSPYTQADLLERDKKLTDSETAKAEAARKAEIAKEAEKPFALTGSNRDADVAASLGQGSLFSRGESKATSTAAAVRAALVERMGEGKVKLLERSGLLKIVDKQTQLPGFIGKPSQTTKRVIKGMSDGKTAYIVAEHINPGQAYSLLLHEAGVHVGMEGLLGKDGYGDLQTGFKRLLDEGDKDALAVEDHVQALIKAGKLRESSAGDERLAYAAERMANAKSPETLSARFRAWVRQLIAAIRARILASPQYQRISKAVRIDPTMQDIAALARLSVERVAVARNVSRETANYSEGSQTDTPAFKKWFGDSQVVDSAGRPQVVYHGAPDARFMQDDGTFKTLRERYGREDNARAFWFANKRSTAASYADDRRAFDYQNADAGVIAAYLKLENPLIIDGGGKEWRDAQARGKTGNVIDEARAGGHDGAIIRNVRDDYLGYGKGNSKSVSDTFVVFSSNQIKSATDNNGDFDSTNADIRYSEEHGREAFDLQVPPDGNAFNLPETTTLKDRFFDKLVFNIVDRFKDLKDLQSVIDHVPEESDAALAETLFSGRARKRLDDLDEFHVEPLLKAIHANGYTMEEVGKYLHARHAPEANEVLRERNPDREDNDALSGMADEEAHGIEEGYRDTPMEEIGLMVDSINTERLAKLVQDGLLSPAEATKWRNTYEFYTPLHRDQFQDDEGEILPTMPKRGSGFHIAGRESQLRAGSTKPVDHRLIVPYVIAQYEASAIRGEKNLVGNTLLALARENPNPDFWDIDKFERVTVLDKDGVIQHVKDGRLHDNELGIKENGKLVRLAFNKKNERAMRLVGELKNLQSKSMPNAVRGVQKFMRYLSLVNTALSPEFVFTTNFLRDLQTAGYNLQDTELKGFGAKVIKDALQHGIRGMWKSLRGSHDSEWAQYADEFERAGGMVGWLDSYDSITDRAKALEKQMQLAASSKLNAKRAIRSLGDFLKDANGAVENAVRLSAYVNARRVGVSEKKAAALAKNLTVNFNQRGAQSHIFNLAYLFFNAGVQGSARLIKALTNSKRVQLYVGATVVASALLELLNRSIACQDVDGMSCYDKIPDYVKERAMVIVTGPGPKDWIKIPLPWGYNIFHVAGRMIGRAIVNKDIPNYSALDDASKLASSMLNAFNPLASGTMLQTISPTILDPAVMIAENKAWYGGPLTPEQNKFDTKKPNSEMYFKSASEPSKDITAWLNSHTGGNEVRPGWWDWSPAWVDTLFSTVGGSMGKFFLNAVDTAERKAKGEPAEWGNVPFIRTFAAREYDTVDKETFYAHKTDIEMLDKELKRYESDTAKDADIRSRAGDAKIALIDELKSIDKTMTSLRKEIRTMGLNQEPEVDIEAKNQELTDMMKEFNRQYYEAVNPKNSARK